MVGTCLLKVADLFIFFQFRAFFRNSSDLVPLRSLNSLYICLSMSKRIGCIPGPRKGRNKYSLYGSNDNAGLPVPCREYDFSFRIHSLTLVEYEKHNLSIITLYKCKIPQNNHQVQNDKQITLRQHKNTKQK